MYDVIVIGAGPVGLACGIEAKRKGLRALIIEKDALVSSLIGYPTGMEFFSTPERLEIGGHPFSTQSYKPTREEGLDYYRRVAEAETKATDGPGALDIRLYEAVQHLDGQDEAFRVVTNKDVYAARKVITATGFYDVPNLLGVPGEDLPKVTHYFKEPYAYAGQQVAVIGAKNSAAKAALSCYRNGAAVTMLVRGAGISDSVKYWIKPDLENRIEEGAINARFNTSVTRITPDALHLNTPDGPDEIANDFVIAATGYRPNYALLEDALGIATRDDAARTPVFDEATFETNRPGLYMAGTVCGGLDTSRWFIENGRHHAAQIMRHITGEDVSEDPADLHTQQATPGPAALAAS